MKTGETYTYICEDCMGEFKAVAGRGGPKKRLCPSCRRERKNKSNRIWAKYHADLDRRRQQHRESEERRYRKPCKGGCGNMAWHRKSGYCRECYLNAGNEKSGDWAASRI